MKLRLTVLWLALLMSLSVAFAQDSGDLLVEGVELRAGQVAPTDGLLLSIPEVRALDRILADLEGEAKIAQAKVIELTMKLEAAQAGLSEAQARLAGAVATIEAEKAKRPTWIESHVGGCLGVGAAYDGEVSGGIVLGYGWKF